jgi:tetratricopeptide (TPR) repeat protein
VTEIVGDDGRAAAHAPAGASLDLGEVLDRMAGSPPVAWWPVLRRRPELLAASVVPAAAARSRLLGWAIARATELRAAHDLDATVERVAEEAGDAAAIAAVIGGSGPTGDAVVPLLDATFPRIDDAAWWELMSDGTEAVLAGELSDAARATVFRMRFGLLASAGEAEGSHMEWAWDRARRDWDEVWAELPDVAGDEQLAWAAAALGRAAADARLDEGLETWADDLAWLVAASGRHGVEQVRRWHEQVLEARQLVADGTEADRRALVTFAVHLGDQYEQAGDPFLLVAAVAAGRRAIDLIPGDDPGRAGVATVLGSLLGHAVFAGVVPPDALTEAIDVQRHALDLTPDDDPHRADRASNLGYLVVQAVQAGVLGPDAVIEAIDLQRHALHLTAEDDLARVRYATNLAAATVQAVDTGRRGPEALLEAIDLQRHALHLTPDGHPQRDAVAPALANLLTQAVSTGIVGPEALTEAIELQRHALDLTHDDAGRARHAANLSTALCYAVEAGLLGPDALTEAVDHRRLALASTPDDHPDRAVHAWNLAGVLLQTVQIGVAGPDVLIEALELQRHALDLTPDDHVQHSRYVSTLAAIVVQAFAARLLDLEVLMEAIELQRHAFSQTPVGHDQRARRASILATLLDLAVEAGRLDSRATALATKLHRHAVDLTPDGHPARAELVNNLCNHLSVVVEAGTVAPDALLEAVDLQRHVLHPMADDHPNRDRYTINLANLLGQAVEAGLLGPEALTEAVGHHRHALGLTPTFHPHRAGRACNLVFSLAQAVAAGVVPAADAAREVAELSDLGWETVRAHTVLPARRRHVVRRLRAVGVLGPPIALAAGEPELAIEVVEALRGHLFAPPIPEGVLHRVPAPLRVRYEAALREVADAERRHRDLGLDPTTITPIHDTLQAAVVAIRDEIGDPAFATRPRLATLAAHLRPGQVAVYLLDADEGGVAVVLHADARVQSIDLPDASTDELLRRAPRLEEIPEDRHATSGRDRRRAMVGATVSMADVRRVAVADPDDRARAQEPSLHLRVPDDLPGWLDRVLVRPLADTIGPVQEVVFVVSDVWALLPLAAATGPDATTLDDRWATSSVPTLRRLGPPSPLGAGRRRRTLMAVGHADDLPALHVEQAVVALAQPDAEQIPRIGAREQSAGPGAVLDALADVDTPVTDLYLGGHGTLLPDRGAGLLLDVDAGQGPVGGVLWGDAIAERAPRLPRALAFVNACSSADGAHDVPEEAVGIANALLHVGFAAVIATTHVVNDLVATIAMAEVQRLRAAEPDLGGAELARRVRTRLRTATCGELAVWASDLVGQVHEADPGVLRPGLGVRIGSMVEDLGAELSVMPADHRPFASPALWSVFTCVGG